MINWYRVHRILKESVPAEAQSTLKDTLTYLYHTEGLSLEDIVKMSNREFFWAGALSKKMRQLGIRIKPKGGDNSTKAIPLTEHDFIEYSARELARKYNVHISTIYDRKNKLMKGEKNEKDKN
jgi:transposase